MIISNTDHQNSLGTSRYVDPVVGSGPIFLGDLHCNGTEDRLINCSHDPVNEFRSCHHWANIGITCRGIEL